MTVGLEVQGEGADVVSHSSSMQVSGGDGGWGGHPG